MTLGLQCRCDHSTDPAAIASFWAEALSWRRTHEQADEVVLEPPAGHPEDGVVPDLVFLRVPAGKTAQNRLHLDPRPDDQAAELARLEGLGARWVSIGQEPDVSWVVLADPDGNEICLLPALAQQELAGG